MSTTTSSSVFCLFIFLQAVVRFTRVHIVVTFDRARVVRDVPPTSSDHSHAQPRGTRDVHVGRALRMRRIPNNEPDELHVHPSLHIYIYILYIISY